METREALSEDGGFLAEVAVRSLHVWITETRILRVVTHDSLTKAQKAHAEYTLQNDASLPTPEPAESAEFTVVVRIHTENCFLQPDTAWNPARTHAGLFEDIKLRFTGVSPLRPDGLVDNFESAYNNTEWLMSQIPEATKEHQGLLSGENGLRRLMFRHVLFEPLTEANTYSEQELALPPVYRTEGWPVVSPTSQAALQAIRDTHRTRPLQAYDMHGALIPPGEYMSKLRGAVAVVRFNMAAYVFGQVPKHRHTFVGDVTYIRVLVPPTAPSVPVSPWKRNVHARDPFSDLLRSPRKMARLQ
ncbi:hypothetical protein CERSUDRAFT_75057 [Gelatoporia subvermispora B]|uniref:Uncharacterized protein n=1 Tax=Ceriporiopsis subvermispora (strain B) TaxID=914234 RepID=M2RAL9_CERS8|nr:hypothetical protein CERSUDRAFT_75057 [Gelatoporia subvermispora B]